MAKPMKAMKAKKWELKPFTAKEKTPWKTATWKHHPGFIGYRGKLPCVLSSAQAVASVRKELKVRKRDHPALFMLGAAGKHIYEAVQAVF